MTLGEFITKWNGKGIDFDGSYGFQCMDLAHQYAVDVVGKDIPAAPGAKDVWDKATPGYDKIKNTPSGVPSPGDIVIWGTAVGPYGHIAVFDFGDTNSFTSFDQNWPINSLCHLQPHNYNGVLGWLHPKSTTPPTPPPAPTPVFTFTDQTKIPLGAPWGDMELGAIRSTLNDQKRDRDNAEGVVKQDVVQQAQLEAEMASLQVQLDDCQKAKTTPATPSTPPSDVFDQLAAFLRKSLRR